MHAIQIAAPWVLTVLRGILQKTEKVFKYLPESKLGLPSKGYPSLEVVSRRK
jgi:hypothetical protein